MKLFLFLFIFCFGYFATLGQNVLELKNSQTGKTRILKSGTKLHFKSAADTVYVKGKIVQIKDTSVVLFRPDFDEESPLVDLRYSEITIIKKPTKFHAFSRTIGTVMAPVGAFFLINGLTNLSRDNTYQGSKTNNEEETTTFTILGGGFLVAGAIPYFIKPKTYDLKKEWTISVKETDKK